MTGEEIVSSLGSVSDIWVIIALIIPGFITFRIFSWLAAYEAEFDQFTTTIYSLICSLFVFLPVAYLNNFASLEDVRMSVISPQVLVELIGFAGLFGVIPGIILKRTFRRRFAFGSAWDRFSREYVGKGVVVYTTDGKQYVGWVKRMSGGKDEAKEISIGNPKLVKRTDGKIEYVELGDELLFTESVIHRILRRAPTKPEAGESSLTPKRISENPANPGEGTNAVNLSERRFNVKLADIQLISSLLVTLGSTLLAVGTGFAFGVLPALKQVLDQHAFDKELVRVLQNHTGITMNYAEPTGALQVLDGMTKIAILYVVVGGGLIAAGFGPAKRILRKYTQETASEDAKK